MFYLRNVPRGTAALALALALTCTGCDDGGRPAAGEAKKPAKAKPAEGKKVRVGDNVYLEVAGDRRRVLVNAEVCLRKGPLEQLLTRKGKKEHEAILAATVDARKIHEALLLARAREGSPVRFLPKYRPASGARIKVTLAYEDRGVKKTVPAQSWIKNTQTGKELESDWVFAGSRLVDNPFDKDAPKFYLANDGDVICVSNFESALLDLPIESSKENAARGFEAWESRIPPLGTEVTVILEPAPADKKANK